MKQLFLYSTLLFLVACAANKKTLTFQSGKQATKVMMRVPKGFASDMGRTDGESIKEFFYAYPDGALLYIYRNASWPTKNAGLVEAAKKPGDKKGRDYPVFKGVDGGLAWKEVQVDSFLIGYKNVPPTRLGVFENALSSFIIK
jgi:hypothetical protein